MNSSPNSPFYVDFVQTDPAMSWIEVEAQGQLTTGSIGGTKF